MDHFGPFWSREYQNPDRNKVILTKMVVLTILGHLVQYASGSTAATPYLANDLRNHYIKKISEKAGPVPL